MHVRHELPIERRNQCTPESGDTRALDLGKKQMLVPEACVCSTENISLIVEQALNNARFDQAKESPESPQTCLFCYHDEVCKRTLGPDVCMLRHTLLEPPTVVMAPPDSKHTFCCELQWCAGDGVLKGHQLGMEFECTRYWCSRGKCR